MHGLVFDIDNTLTPPRRPVPEPMAAALQSLALPFHLAAGSDLALVRQQFLEPLHAFGFRGTFDAFVSNGANRCRCTLAERVEVESISVFRLEEHLGREGFQELGRRIRALLQDVEFVIDDPRVHVSGPQLIDRGAMINLAPIGRPPMMDAEAFRNRDAFVAYDRRTSYRERMMNRLREEFAPWRGLGLRVNLGGQTSFDIVVEGFDKRNPIRTLLSEGFSALTYFGDALHEGGNDAAVLEFIRDWPGEGRCPVEVEAVEGWEDTLARLRQRSFLGRKSFGGGDER